VLLSRVSMSESNFHQRLPEWQLCRGFSGSFPLEWVAGFAWNEWQAWSGIRTQSSKFNARIFTMEEELPFAGHPVIGATALLHSEFFPKHDAVPIEFVIQDRYINALSRRKGASYFAEMDQGNAFVGPPIPAEKNEAFLKSLNISSTDLAPDLPLQVVSTGLPYLIVPIISNLDRARIITSNFADLLATVGARFVYVLQVNKREGRTWDNDGRVEDIATGSAAGPAAV
jgi:trans-2,3-dihydro-3-hydroxyanthranilate isomerase